MHSLSDWLQPADTDVAFTEERWSGEPGCLCSRCLLPILRENEGLRYRVKRTGYEFRYHFCCLGVELLELKPPNTETEGLTVGADSWYGYDLDDDEIDF